MGAWGVGAGLVTVVVGIALDHNVRRWAALCEGLGVISCGLRLLLNRLNLRIAVDGDCFWWLAFIGRASVLQENAAGFVSDVVGIGWFIVGGGLPFVESNRFGFG